MLIIASRAVYVLSAGPHSSTHYDYGDCVRYPLLCAGCAGVAIQEIIFSGFPPLISTRHHPHYELILHGERPALVRVSPIPTGIL